ncbi:uncharacterized protein BXZ73DRAFT_48442, partial [Epithele typhae]|uniref:uncharacterized protein n=1 Tax=Epithele typhae TaxID=378194 RepID=UPI002008D408
VVEPAKKKRKTSEDPEAVATNIGPPKGAKRTSSAATAMTNGTTKPNGTKGKTRADQSAVNGEAMEVEEAAIEPDDDDAPEPPAPRAGRGTKQAKMKNGAAVPARPSKEEERLRREVEDLRAQLTAAQEATTERDKLDKTLQELFRLRSEPEQELKEFQALFDDTVQKKDSLIHELTGQLSQLQSPSKSSANGTHTLHFMTREAADAEKKALLEENSRLKEALKQRDAAVTAKEQEVLDAREEAKMTKKELELEIERSKTMVSRTGGPLVPRSIKATATELRNAVVIKLYEDMTNFLVMNVKMEKSPEWPDIEEELMTCVYTYSSEDDAKFCTWYTVSEYLCCRLICSATLTALNFVLRNMYGRPDNMPVNQRVSRDELVLKVKYVPNDLDKEDPDIVERLDFFKDPFMFARDQMTVFLRTLNETVQGIFEHKGSAGVGNESTEVIVVE